MHLSTSGPRILQIQQACSPAHPSRGWSSPLLLSRSPPYLANIFSRSDFLLYSNFDCPRHKYRDYSANHFLPYFGSRRRYFLALDYNLYLLPLDCCDILYTIEGSIYIRHPFSSGNVDRRPFSPIFFPSCALALLSTCPPWVFPGCFPTATSTYEDSLTPAPDGLDFPGAFLYTNPHILFSPFAPKSHVFCIKLAISISVSATLSARSATSPSLIAEFIFTIAVILCISKRFR